jgi:hypothetical protein
VSSRYPALWQDGSSFPASCFRDLLNRNLWLFRRFSVTASVIVAAVSAQRCTPDRDGSLYPRSLARIQDLVRCMYQRAGLLSHMYEYVAYCWGRPVVRCLRGSWCMTAWYVAPLAGSHATQLFVMYTINGMVASTNVGLTVWLMGWAIAISQMAWLEYRTDLGSYPSSPMLNLCIMCTAARCDILWHSCLGHVSY